MFLFEDNQTNLIIFEKSVNYLNILQRVQLRSVCRLWRILIDNLDKEIVDYSSYPFSNTLFPSDKFDFRNILLHFNFNQAIRSSFLDRLRIFKSNYAFKTVDLKALERLKFLNYLEVGEIDLSEEGAFAEIRLASLQTLYINEVNSEAAVSHLRFDLPNLKKIFFGGDSICLIDLKDPLTVEYLDFNNVDKRTLDKIFEYKNVRILICNRVIDANLKLNLDKNKIYLAISEQLLRLEVIHCNLENKLMNLNYRYSEKVNKYKDALEDIYKVLNGLTSRKDRQQNKLKAFIQGVRIDGELTGIKNFQKEFQIQDPLTTLHLKYNKKSDRIDSIIRLNYAQFALMNLTGGEFKYLNDFLTNCYPNLQIINLIKPDHSLNSFHFLAFLKHCNTLINLNIQYLHFANDDLRSLFYAKLTELQSCKTLTKFILYDEERFVTKIDFSFLAKFNYLHYFETNLCDAQQMTDIAFSFHMIGDLNFIVAENNEPFNLNIMKIRKNGIIKYDLKLLNHLGVEVQTSECAHYTFFDLKKETLKKTIDGCFEEHKIKSNEFLKLTIELQSSI